MGQKINPIGFRLGVNRTADSRWYANTGEYGVLLHQDLKMRDMLMSELKQAGISKVVIERVAPRRKPGFTPPPAIQMVKPAALC